jgi:hypothetical protein
MPQPTAFNEHVKPYIEWLLRQEAEHSISNKKFRNFSMGGSRIEKEVKRVFLGLYRIVYKYDEQDYSIWSSGDGQKVYYNELPFDPHRKQILDEKQLAKESIPLKTGWLNFGLWVCIIGAFFTFGISLIGAIIFGILRSNKKKEHNARLAEKQRDIDDFDGQLTSVKHQFKSQKKAFRGIYEKVSGDASAF